MATGPASGGRLRGAWPAARWRALLAVGLVCGIGLLPWLSRTDPALTVLRARAAERTPSPEAIAAVRDELGLADGPLHLLAHWAGGLLAGDAGQSWISGDDVLPSVAQALGVSLLLMGAALVAACLTAAVICARTLYLSAHRRTARRRSRGSVGAMAAALPEFLIASVLAADPDVVILDEPTAGQDLAGLLRLTALIDGLQQRGKAVITISHDMEFVAQNFDRVIVMADRAVVRDARADEIFYDTGAMERASLRPPALAQAGALVGPEVGLDIDRLNAELAARSLTPTTR